MCDSSNASESISVREAKKQRQMEENQNSISNRLFLPKISSPQEKIIFKIGSSVSSVSSKGQMYKIPDYEDWMSGKKQREHEERIARGVGLLVFVNFLNAVFHKFYLVHS